MGIWWNNSILIRIWYTLYFTLCSTTLDTLPTSPLVPAPPTTPISPLEPTPVVPFIPISDPVIVPALHD